MVKRMKVLYEVVTTFGPNRIKNQDNYYLNGLIKETANEQRRDVSVSQYQMYALCDGMGGETSGDKAADLAVLALRENFSDCKGIDLQKYIKKANKRICEYQQMYGIRMGTTFAGLYIENKRLTAINLGDSRIYQIDETGINQISKDHNEYQTMIDAEIEFTEQAAKRAKSRLTQFLGMEDEEIDLEPQIYVNPTVSVGESYLICSDGLSDTLSDAEIEKIMLAGEPVEDNICEILIKQAEQKNAKDNMTVIRLYILEDTEQ